MAGHKRKVNQENAGGYKTNKQKINLPQCAFPKGLKSSVHLIKLLHVKDLQQHKARAPVWTLVWIQGRSTTMKGLGDSTLCPPRPCYATTLWETWSKSHAFSALQCLYPSELGSLTQFFYSFPSSLFLEIEPEF